MVLTLSDNTTAVLDVAGRATWTYRPEAVSIASALTVTFPGDANNAFSSAFMAVEVTKASPRALLTADPATVPIGSDVQISFSLMDFYGSQEGLKLTLADRASTTVDLTVFRSEVEVGDQVELFVKLYISGREGPIQGVVLALSDGTTASLNEKGEAWWTYSATTSGVQTLMATYAGDDLSEGSSGSVDITVKAFSVLGYIKRLLCPFNPWCEA